MRVFLGLMVAAASAVVLVPSAAAHYCDDPQGPASCGPCSPSVTEDHSHEQLDGETGEYYRCHSQACAPTDVLCIYDALWYMYENTNLEDLT